MKYNLNLVLFCLIAILSSTAIEAQYRQGNRMGYPYNGRPNSIIPRANDEKPEAKPLTAEEIVKEELPKIVEAANLNAFEEAVVGSILTKYLKQTIELRLLELEPRDTKEKLEKIREAQNAELKAGLPEEKYDLVMEIQEKGANKVKSQQKKKKKKKKVLFLKS